MSYYNNRTGMGGKVIEELIRSSVANVNKTNRSYNVTIRNSILNVVDDSVKNSAGVIEYPDGSLMAGSFSSRAGA